MTAPPHWKLREIEDYHLADPPRRARCGGCHLTPEGLSHRSTYLDLWLNSTCSRCCRRYHAWLTGRGRPDRPHGRPSGPLASLRTWLRRW